MTCPCIPNYSGVPFDPRARPMVAAALLSGPLIEPADGVRWFSRDLNELHSRGWARPFRMRQDRMWFYELTREGMAQATRLLANGYTFDGYDLWLFEELVR